MGNVPRLSQALREAHVTLRCGRPIITLMNYKRIRITVDGKDIFCLSLLSTLHPLHLVLCPRGLGLQELPSMGFYAF